MLHPKQHIADLSEICFQSGIKYIVISPGSRNAPLIESFYSKFGEQCISIVDERSAGYFALGLARTEGNPVALVCTSGTAILNYGPAVAEAYYARIPLLAITADRPAEWIDQQDNQTIRQRDIFRNIVLKSFHLPETVGTLDELLQVQQLVCQAIEHTRFPCSGPVHLNIPVREPLYESLPHFTADIIISSESKLSEVPLPDTFLSQYQAAKRVMIIHGLDFPGTKVVEPLLNLAKNQGILVVAENISNISFDGVIANPELLLAHVNSEKLEAPDLLLYSGGQITSKRLKQYLRGIRNLNVWRIGIDDYRMDTFKQGNTILEAPADLVYNKIELLNVAGRDEQFISGWYDASRKIRSIRDQAIEESPFSDLVAFNAIINAIPAHANLELGNSTPIRYTQFFDTIAGVKYRSNRGVSGIDGSLSSAVGTAFASKELTLAIIGDLSLIYDSNALWNKRLPDNLRIIVINNQGGGIFSLLDGPRSKASFEEYVEAYHPVDIQKLVEAFNLDYFCVVDLKSLTHLLPVFLNDSGKTRVLEVRTIRENNCKAFNLITGRSSADEKKN
jgi:2-succinyl-5-enolpyruvyl-6-hydroxy-3-cyclohexene-1-carboxylate synthase